MKPQEIIENMKLYIKNMVCNRCNMVVETELKRLGYTPVSVTLGEVTIVETLSESHKKEVSNMLESFGFELIDDKRSRLIEQIKTNIVELIHYNEDDRLKTNLSDYLSEKLHLDYNYMSTIFSEMESTTIEKYLIAQKIERVKELLVYDELNLSEIAEQLNYSSVAHLSAQFKKTTGLTPSYFKKIGAEKRKPLDEV